eukprot:6484976-Amphidinium_carterae.3
MARTTALSQASKHLSLPRPKGSKPVAQTTCWSGFAQQTSLMPCRHPIAIPGVADSPLAA